ncbi:MAG TPA: FAD-binding oxidoreductase, partial [Nitrosomonas nitrosa]|nr:FAD-binding oxidoreductase [Nitrosomonas nitrosa]
MLTELIHELRAFLPPDAVLYEAEDVKPYECDGLSAYRRTAMIVVLPQTEEEIIKILQLCHSTKTPVVARGAG